MGIKKSYCSPISVFLMIVAMMLVASATGRQSSAFEFDPDYPVGTPPVIGGTGYVTEERYDGDGLYNAQDWQEYNSDTGGYHPGEDWNGDGGGSSDVGTPVYAMAGGTVVAIKDKVFTSGDYGSGIVIEHTLPNDKKIYSVYVHIDITSGLNVGDFVGQGDRIGTIANITSLPPHLHFEIRTKQVGQDWYPNDNGLGYYASKENLLADGFTVDPSDFIDSYRSPGTAVENGLVAYYPFDGDANDASGNGNHGMLNGDPRFVSAVKGMGLKLGGVHSPGGTVNPDYVLVKNSPSLQFTDRMTVSYFVMIDGTQAQTSADCSGRSINEIYGNVLGKSGDRTGFYFRELDTISEFGIDSFNGVFFMKSDQLPSLFNTFRHIAYTISDNTVRLYIDGVLKNTMTSTVPLDRANAQDMYIGVQNNEIAACLKYWYPLEGIIDELRIYNRALNDAEVSQLFEM
jgi:murein DD-endopeptidase MepM/ murein hydrolase activator NlpD